MATAYSLRTIVRSFSPTAASQPWMFRSVIRPLSFPITWFVLRLGMTANHATVTGLLVGVLGNALFIVGTRNAILAGVVCYVSFLIFDFVDGNIARVTNSATYWGKFLDGSVDTLIEVLLPLTLSIAVFRATGSFSFLIFGVALSVASLYASFLFTRLSFFNRWVEMERRVNAVSPAPHHALNPLQTKRFPLTAITNITTDCKIAAIVFMGIVGLHPALLTLILVVIGIHTLPLIVIPLLDAAHHLNVRRTSKWDPRTR